MTFCFQTLVSIIGISSRTMVENPDTYHWVLHLIVFYNRFVTLRQREILVFEGRKEAVLLLLYCTVLYNPTYNEYQERKSTRFHVRWVKKTSTSLPTSRGIVYGDYYWYAYELYTEHANSSQFYSAVSRIVNLRLCSGLISQLMQNLYSMCILTELSQSVNVRIGMLSQVYGHVIQ